MPIIFQNNSESPVGLVSADNEMLVAPAMGGSLVFEPDFNSQQIVDIYVSSGQGVVTVGNVPENTEAPSISGDAKVGEELTATNGTWSGDSPITYAVAWQRSVGGAAFADISGATEATYTLQAEDEGNTVRAKATATNGFGSAVSYSDASDVIEAA